MVAAKQADGPDTFVVSGPLVLVKDETGAVQYLYQGAVVPGYVSSEDVARLVADGLVSQVK